MPKYPNTQYFVPYLDPYTCKGLARIAAESRSDDLKWSDFGCTNKRINKGPTKATQHLSVNSARFAHKFSKKLNPWNHQRMRPASLQSLSPRETSCQEAKGLRASGMSEATAQQHHEASSSCTARWRVHPRDLGNSSTDESLKCINDQQMIQMINKWSTCFRCSTISTCFNVAMQKSWIQGSKARLMKSISMSTYIYRYICLTCSMFFSFIPIICSVMTLARRTVTTKVIKCLVKDP